MIFKPDVMNTSVKKRNVLYLEKNRGRRIIKKKTEMDEFKAEINVSNIRIFSKVECF
jgi:hypothetical protein